MKSGWVLVVSPKPRLQINYIARRVGASAIISAAGPAIGWFHRRYRT
jgi:hypothetical protein